MKTLYKNNKRSIRDIRDITMDVIERWLNDDDWHVRLAAMHACQSKDIHPNIIERWLNDNNWRVRQVAVCYCEQKGISY